MIRGDRYTPISPLRSGQPMKRWLGIVLLALLLAACGGAAATQPTPGPDLFVVQSDTLPGDLHTFTTALPWQIYPGIPKSSTVAYYEIYQGSDKRNEVGHISIVHYDAPDALEQAHRAILEEVAVESQPGSVPDVGERALMTGPTPSWDNSDVLFVRCSTVVHATAPISLGAMRDVAKRLDERLRQAAC